MSASDQVPGWFLSEAAEALGRVRPEDGAPYSLTAQQVLDSILALRDERDHYRDKQTKLRAARAHLAVLLAQSTECDDAILVHHAREAAALLDRTVPPPSSEAASP